MDKIVCVGKNYLEHAKELGDAIPDKPVLFLKPPSVLKQVQKNQQSVTLRIPDKLVSVHYECEVVLKIRGGGYRLSLADAEKCIESVTLGLDMTLRETQTQLKKNGHPWEIAKVFLDAAVTGPFVDVRQFGNYLNEKFSFELGGSVKQSGTANEMILSPASCVAHASHYFPLCDGDLLFTGTPAGVGPVTAGQKATLKWGPICYFTQWEYL